MCTKKVQTIDTKNMRNFKLGGNHEIDPGRITFQNIIFLLHTFNILNVKMKMFHFILTNKIKINEFLI